MKKRKRIEAEDDIDLNITPMLDIVFIILIFFVVATSFVKESGVDVSRPGAHSSERKERGNIMIGVDQEGDIYMEGKRVDYRSVRPLIERALAEDPDSGIVIVAEGYKQGTEAVLQYLRERKDELGFSMRVTVLGHVQRGGRPSAYDRIRSRWLEGLI